MNMLALKLVQSNMCLFELCVFQVCAIYYFVCMQQVRQL